MSQSIDESVHQSVKLWVSQSVSELRVIQSINQSVSQCNSVIVNQCIPVRPDGNGGHDVFLPHHEPLHVVLFHHGFFHHFDGARTTVVLLLKTWLVISTRRDESVRQCRKTCERVCDGARTTVVLTTLCGVLKVCCKKCQMCVCVCMCMLCVYACVCERVVWVGMCLR